MRLTDYPLAIAQAQRQILRATQEVEGLLKQLQSMEAIIDQAIVSDTSFKNESQRKARKTIILEENQDYQISLARLDRLKHDQANLKIDLELLQNQFSVSKLFAREAIANGQITTRLDCCT